MASQIEIDVTELQDMFRSMGTASTALKSEMQTWLDAIGKEFLRIVQDEIVRRQVVDTRALLNSFEKDTDANIWRLSDGNMMLEVGASLEYAAFVNDGHWTIDPNSTRHFTLPNGELARYVPGYWSGDRFIYDPSAETGMVLKQQWVEGEHYFDSALKIMETMMPELIEAKMDEWLQKYF